MPVSNRKKSPAAGFSRRGVDVPVRAFAAGIAGVLMGSGVALAADADDDSLAEIVVAATRTAQKVEDVPARVDVITAQDIAARNVTSITEALQTSAGIYMNPVAGGGITMRGYGSTDILVLVDGQPMNSGWNGEMNWEMVPVEQVERVEIVRGGSSSLYGGRAVGGVINITTKGHDAQRKQRIEGNVSYGTYDTRKASASFDRNLTDELSLGLGYENRSSDGWAGFYRALSPVATGTPVADVTLPRLGSGSYVVGGRGEKEWENTNLSFRVRYGFGESRSLQYRYMKTKNEYAYNNPFSYALDAGGNPVFNGVVRTQDGNLLRLTYAGFLGYVGLRDTDVHTLNYRDDASGIRLDVGMSDTGKDGYSSPASPTSENWTGAGTYSFYPSRTYNIDFQKTWEFGRHTLVSGFNGRQESFDQVRYYMDSWIDLGSVTDFYEKHGGKARNLSVFAQDQFQLTDRLGVYAGGRYDRFRRYDGYSRFYTAGEVLDTARSRDHDKGSFSEFSPKVAVDYLCAEGLKCYVSYGRAFTTPLLNQTFRYSGTSTTDVIANPDLKPEISDTLEAGVKKSFGMTSAGLSVYRAKTRDKVLYITHPTFKRYENVGREVRDGVEVDVTHKFTSAWSAYANYAWERGEITSLTGVTTPNRDIPRHLAHGGVSFGQGRWQSTLDAHYVSERQSPDSASGEYGAEDAFFLVNYYASFALRSGLTLQASVQNLMDRRFFATEATAGRTFTAGIRLVL